MNLSRFPNHPLWLRRAACRSHQQSLMQRAEIETTVEAVGEGREVSRRVFAEGERMIAAAQAGLEISEHGVDPFELRQVLGPPIADDSALVCAAGLGHRSETGQPV